MLQGAMRGFHAQEPQHAMSPPAGAAAAHPQGESAEAGGQLRGVRIRAEAGGGATGGDEQGGHKMPRLAVVDGQAAPTTRQRADGLMVGSAPWSAQGLPGGAGPQGLHPVYDTGVDLPPPENDPGPFGDHGLGQLISDEDDLWSMVGYPMYDTDGDADDFTPSWTPRALSCCAEPVAVTVVVG